MIKKVKSFFEGNWRYVFRAYLPTFLKDQIELRYKAANACLDNGACLECGCKTPELFYATKGCSKEVNPCYPELLSKKEWEELKQMSK